MATKTHETKQGQLGPAARASGLEAEAAGPSPEDLDRRQANMRRARRGPLAELKEEPESFALEGALEAEVAPTECAEPPAAAEEEEETK